jgi:hypothetical protein
METSKCADVMGTHHCKEKALLAMAGNSMEDKGRDWEGMKQTMVLIFLYPHLLQKKSLASSDNGEDRDKQVSQGEGAADNNGQYNGGLGKRWGGNEADNSVDVFCAPSCQRFDDVNGDDLAEPMSKGKTDGNGTKTLLSPSSLATSLS